jgi:hypothetical protein
MLSASLKIGERRQLAGRVRHLAGHANVWIGLATLGWIPLAHGQAAQLATSASQILWYEKPAENWESEALPIGNGRLGAMIFGAADRKPFNSTKTASG